MLLPDFDIFEYVSKRITQIVNNKREHNIQLSY